MQGEDLSQEYRLAQEIARRITADAGAPFFYTEQKNAVETSGRLFRDHPLVGRAIAVLGADPERIGHGLSHVTKVAVDAGAIILVERAIDQPTDRVLRLVTLAHVAGVLHDIKREEKDHARKGADESVRILREFDLSEGERSAVVDAIGNHEAFRPVLPLDDPDWQLLSDALYDADKFRWGPDNFSEMLWDMVTRRNVPLSAVLGRFLRGLDGVGRIRETFRSETGRRYGPDFIDRGMEIGRRLYAELTREQVTGDR
jgi:hypothetical protein